MLVPGMLFSQEYHGAVKEVIIQRVNSRQDTTLVSCEKFNENGKLTEYIEFLPNKDTAASIVYTYDKNDNKTREIHYEGNHLKKHKEYTYNQQGLLKEKIRIAPDGSPGRRTLYQYDDYNRLIEESVYNNEKLQSQIIRKYNAENLLIKENRKLGNIANESSFSYDSLNRLVEKDFGNYKEYFAYNRSGKIIREVKEYPADSRKEVVEYTYGNMNNLLEKKVYDYTGKLQHHNTFIYDSLSRITGESKYYGTDLRERKEYRYDKYGNTISIKVYDSCDSLKETTSRAFSDANRVISESITNYSISPQETLKKQFNESGQPVVIEKMNQEYEVTGKTILEYDKHQNLLTKTIFFNGKLDYEIIYTYKSFK